MNTGHDYSPQELPRELHGLAEMRAFLREQRRRQMAEALAAAAQLHTPIEADDITALLCRHSDNATRFVLFVQLAAAYELTPEAYAAGLRDAYTTGKAGNVVTRAEVLSMFANVKDKRLYMTADEMTDYDAMPATIRIYRGCSRTELRRRIFGCSWTTRQEIAEFFAWRFDAQDSSRIVVAADIPKADVLAFFNGMKEYEIIADIHGGSAQDYTAIEQPTPLYWDYMNRRQP